MFYPVVERFFSQNHNAKGYLVSCVRHLLDVRAAGEGLAPLSLLGSGLFTWYHIGFGGISYRKFAATL